MEKYKKMLRNDFSRRETRIISEYWPKLNILIQDFLIRNKT